ncbi:hypothetical protein M758_11G065400 [Ceratodon purpureus]|uniref:Uncharacterized protein n=1 Tax=Ceratodon purpureus TaxID=3225 RepID=A0A8T0GE57_CERPU|nr:hypothetical protein KC19_11G067200 [Ceratodon purpureus]KAG0600846.1 hypothetical protein M758_11G065400 [Ceratodon purpureus]
MRLLNEQKIWKYGRLGPVWPGSLAMVLVIRIRADFKSSPATYSERGLFPCVGGARHRPTWYHARCSAQLGLGGIACLLGDGSVVFILLGCGPLHLHNHNHNHHLTLRWSFTWHYSTKSKTR